MRNAFDYRRLVDYAKLRGMKVVEGSGPDLKDGVRLSRAGEDWIVINYNLSELEKTKTLRFLLDVPDNRMKFGDRLKSSISPEGSAFLFSLQCPAS